MPEAFKLYEICRKVGKQVLNEWNAEPYLSGKIKLGHVVDHSRTISTNLLNQSAILDNALSKGAVSSEEHATERAKLNDRIDAHKNAGQFIGRLSADEAHLHKRLNTETDPAQAMADFNVDVADTEASMNKKYPNRPNK